MEVSIKPYKKGRYSGIDVGAPFIRDWVHNS